MSSAKEKIFRLGNVMINIVLFFMQRQILAVFEEGLQAVVFSDDPVLQKYHKVSSSNIKTKLFSKKFQCVNYLFTFALVLRSLRLDFRRSFKSGLRSSGSFSEQQLVI